MILMSLIINVSLSFVIESGLSKVKSYSLLQFHKSANLTIFKTGAV